MNERLKQAFDEASKLPQNEQEALARWLLEEIASERRWEEMFERSGDRLAELAAEATSEYRARKTKKLDPDAL